MPTIERLTRVPVMHARIHRSRVENHRALPHGLVRAYSNFRASTRFTCSVTPLDSLSAKTIGNEILHLMGKKGASKADSLVMHGVTGENAVLLADKIAARLKLPEGQIQIDPEQSIIHLARAVEKVFRELAAARPRHTDEAPKKSPDKKSGKKAPKREVAPKEDRLHFYQISFTAAKAGAESQLVEVRSEHPSAVIQEAFKRMTDEIAVKLIKAATHGAIEFGRIYVRRNGDVVEGHPDRSEFIIPKRRQFWFIPLGRKPDIGVVIGTELFTFHDVAGEELGSVEHKLQAKRAF